MPPKPRKKKHHFLPEFYLAGFTQGGTKDSGFLVFDFGRREVRGGTPSSVGYERYFYAVEGEEPDVLEDALGECEGKVAATVREVVDGTVLKDGTFQTLTDFMALMELRTPAFRANLLPQMSQLYNLIAEFNMAAPNAYERHVESCKRSGKEPLTRDRFERAKKAVLGGHIEFIAKPGEHLDIMVGIVGRIAGVLRKRTWSVVSAPEGSGGFVTCDRPLTVYWSHEARVEERSIDPTIASPRGEMFFPLTRTLGLVGRTPPEPVQIKDPDMVAHLNTKVVNATHRFLFAPDRVFRWIRGEIVDGAALETALTADTGDE